MRCDVCTGRRATGTRDKALYPGPRSLGEAEPPLVAIALDGHGRAPRLPYPGV